MWPVSFVYRKPNRRPATHADAQTAATLTAQKAARTARMFSELANSGIRLLKNRSSMGLMPCCSLWINPQRRYYDESECKGEGNISKSYIVSAASHIAPLESLAATECLDRHRLFFGQPELSPAIHTPGQTPQKMPYLFRSERTTVSRPNLPRSPAYNSHRDFRCTASGIFIRISLEG